MRWTCAFLLLGWKVFDELRYASLSSGLASNCAIMLARTRCRRSNLFTFLKNEHSLQAFS
jgi:hypothetical protein